jgi:hypothetical protein
MAQSPVEQGQQVEFSGSYWFGRSRVLLQGGREYPDLKQGGGALGEGAAWVEFKLLPGSG